MAQNLTALYLRLSRDDGSLYDSESILNQKAFLSAYADANSFNVVGIFSDDGFSGLDFNRPGFRRMIDMIERRQINTVITKDLSRLGRDYIEVGNYIDRYFPAHNVRYIAVNDGIDTASDCSANDMTPFRAVFNDMYAKDISKKVRTALMTKKLEGKFIGSQPPYGYKKDPNDKNHLIIDEEAAVYVRRIYREFLSGKTVLGIAHDLSLMQIPTPAAQKNHSCAHTPINKLWNDSTVRRILTNPTYAGHLTQNFSQKISYKVNKKARLPKSDWIIAENTHEPIVSQADFDSAAEILSKRSYSRKSRPSPHLLSGLVFCADCGGGMSFIRESETRTYLVCSRWRKNAGFGICTSHCIRESLVEDIVKSALRKSAESVSTSEILSSVRVSLDNNHGERLLAEQLKHKLNICAQTLLSLYKDKASGAVSQEEYAELSAAVHTERAAYLRQLDELNAAVCQPSPDSLSESLKALVSFEHPDRSTLLLLIDKIYIGKSKEIELHFKFCNPL